MQMKEKFTYLFLIHFSALMLVFLFAGVIQLLFGNMIMTQLQNPVISTMVNIMKTTVNYSPEKLLIGMITFLFFIPLDLSILYSASRELFEKDDIMKSIEEGIVRYPLFLVFFSDIYFFSFVYPWFTPVVLFILFRILEPETDWRLHIVSTLLIGTWLIPIALVGRIDDIVLRNVLSLILYLGLALPFFVHSWVRKEGLR